MLKRYQNGCNVSERKLKEHGLEELIDEVSLRREKRCKAHGCDNFKYSKKQLMDILDAHKGDYKQSKGARGMSNVKLYLGYLITSIDGPEDDVFKPLRLHYKKFDSFVNNVKKAKGGAITKTDKNAIASSLFSLMMNNRTELNKYKYKAS